MKTRTVLVAEDQLDLLAIAELYLQRNGYRVFTAEDGETAVQLAQQHRPDVIVMDFSLPKMDGLGAVAKLREDPETCDIPVILMTAHSYGAVGRRAYAAGCAAFLSKPCEPRRLLADVHRLIGGAHEV